jgi:hypothetical protein
MTAFTVHASKNGETVQTFRINPTMTVAKARALHNEGWLVHIIDSDGSRREPADFDQVPASTPRPPASDPVKERRALREQRIPIRFTLVQIQVATLERFLMMVVAYLIPQPRGS